MFASVLVANRGEIAVRIERTLRRLGIESIAVYSDADAGAVHVRGADRAEWIGPTPASRSYLDVDQIIAAARRSGADAIHPGYGFLSESPRLARACREHGIVFVGPGPEAMALLGDKIAAKHAADAAGVPTLPGLSGEALDAEEILAWAEDAQFPLLIKSAAGGGGKGMRVVASLAELSASIEAAQREAKAAFGDARLLVERFVEASRHIEIQVLADAHRGAVHLGERECSLQRRHQKIIEEAPSPVVGSELRRRMGEAAIDLVRASGYVNAATVELIVEREDPARFFFLEVNTRLQVEHAVTEAVTGLDLVELQLRIAAGEPLGFGQADVQLGGWAVEARVYAEDSASGFLPSSGRVVVYREPADLRVDSGIETGTEVGTDYDPMLAKLIAHGSDRAEALSRLRRGLGAMVIAGPTTNVPYLHALLERPEVAAGDIDTGFVERLAADVAAPLPSPVLSAVALLTLLGEPDDDDPWSECRGWRAGGAAWIQLELEGPDGHTEVALRRCTEGWDWRAGDASGVLAFDGRTLTAGDRASPVEVHSDGEEVWVIDAAAGPVRFRRAPAASAAEESKERSLEAPMPGTVIDVRTEPGAAVRAGQTLLILESMKMELSIESPRDGTIAAVLVATGEHVDRGAILIALAKEESPA